MIKPRRDPDFVPGCPGVYEPDRIFILNAMRRTKKAPPDLPRPANGAELAELRAEVRALRADLERLKGMRHAG